MVQKFDVWFAPAGQNRRIHLYLPDEYDNTSERYPVLYMFDGHNLFFDSDATYGTCLGLKEFLDSWGKRLIVVGLACASEDLQRVHEYCPYTIDSSIYGHVEGSGDLTFQWIVKELKPFIDGNYRTWPQREATAIAGYSLGGMMSLYGVLRYNSVFSKAAVISPAFAPAMGHFRREAANEIDADTRIFFSWGTDEDNPAAVGQMVSDILEIEKAVQAHGARTWLCCQSGGHHNEASWRWQVPEWMQFLWF